MKLPWVTRRTHEQSVAAMKCVVKGQAILFNDVRAERDAARALLAEYEAENARLTDLTRTACGQRDDIREEVTEDRVEDLTDILDRIAAMHDYVMDLRASVTRGSLPDGGDGQDGMRSETKSSIPCDWRSRDVRCP